MTRFCDRLILIASPSASALLLVACSTAIQNPALPAATMQIGGEAYVIRQLTAGTWTASSKAGDKALPATPAGRAALRDAIEKTSGCKVSDSDYSRAGMQFDAQVDCGSRLSN